MEIVSGLRSSFGW